MDEENTPSVPPRQTGRPRGKRYGKLFLIALVFAVLTDVGARIFELHAVTRHLESFNQAVVYGLESASFWSLINAFRTRVTEDRYHYAVWSWRAPFNLSEACRNLPAVRNGDAMWQLCLPPPAFVPERFRGLISLSMKPQVNDSTYPRHVVEYVLGLPDATMHALGCAWHGWDSCHRPFPDEPERSNWFGKVILSLVGLAACAFVIDASSTGDGLFDVLLVFGLCVLLFLLYASIVCVWVVMVVSVLEAFAHKLLPLSSVLGGLMGFLPALWVFAVVKDFALDRVKDYVAQKME